MEKKIILNALFVLCTHPSEIEVCQRNVLSGSGVHSALMHSHFRGASSVDLMTKLTEKLLVELPAMEELGLCSLATSSSLRWN